MQGRDGGGPRLPNLDSSGILREDSQTFNHWSNSVVLAPSPPPPPPLPIVDVTCRSTVLALLIITLLTAPIPPLLRLAGAGHRSSLVMMCPALSATHLGLAGTKKLYGTIRLCLWGGDCEAKCLRLFSQAKLYRVLSRFTQNFPNLVMVITKESDFNTCYCRSKLLDSDYGDLQTCCYSNSCLNFLPKFAAIFCKFAIKFAKPWQNFLKICNWGFQWIHTRSIKKNLELIVGSPCWILPISTDLLNHLKITKHFFMNHYTSN